MKKRSGALDLQKFIFSVLMVLFHSRKFAQKGELSLFRGGALLVEFFFITSGILMAASVAKDIATADRVGLSPPDSQIIASDTLRFMKRKIASLCPEYYVAWILQFIILHVFDRGAIIWDLFKSAWSLTFSSMTGLTAFDPNPVTWYIGAMLLVMLVLYPIMRHCRDIWFYVLAPVLVIFLMGYSFRVYKNLSAPHFWAGWYFKGMLRAVMEISLGTICYKISQAIAPIPFTKLARFFFSAVVIGGYALVVAFLWNHTGSKYDWTIILIFAVCITITFSNVGALSRVLVHPFLNKLGVFSYSLYLAHYGWCRTIPDFFPGRTYMQRLPYYLLASFLTAFAIYFISAWLRTVWRTHKGSILSLIIVK